MPPLLIFISEREWNGVKTRECSVDGVFGCCCWGNYDAVSGCFRIEKLIWRKEEKKKKKRSENIGKSVKFQLSSTDTKAKAKQDRTRIIVIAFWVRMGLYLHKCHSRTLPLLPHSRHHRGDCNVITSQVHDNSTEIIMIKNIFIS